MTFKARLLAAMRVGDLRPGDLKHWFGLSYATTRYWVVEAQESYEPKRRSVLRDLESLELAIERGVGFPIPDKLSSHARPGYLRQLHRAVDEQFPRDDPAGRGAEVLGNLPSGREETDPSVV